MKDFQFIEYRLFDIELFSPPSDDAGELKDELARREPVISASGIQAAGITLSLVSIEVVGTGGGREVSGDAAWQRSISNSSSA